MKSGNQFASTFYDNFRKRGTMEKIISYRAQVEIRKMQNTYFVHYSLMTGILNLINSFKTLLNIEIKLLSVALTLCLIESELFPFVGY